MRKKGFPINDLLRRKLQTSTTIVTLMLSAGSTLFLLLFSSRLGSTLISKSGLFTLGLNAIFSQFLIFVEILVIAVGAVLTSFIVFLMMAQRTRDFGLMKAAGCPNTLVAGYFVTELLLVSLIGCILGVAFGVLVDYVSANLVFSSYVAPNFWFTPLVFFAFFGLAVFFGLRPILKASKMPPIMAISPVGYYGLVKAGYSKVLARSGLSWRIAFRSLFRRQTATARIILLLSTVFILLTVSVAGGIIAGTTTTTWVQETVDSSTIAIAHNNMENQYMILLSKFSGVSENGNFDYKNPNLAISFAVVERLKSLSTVDFVDSRLIVMEHAQEVANFTVDPDTLATLPVGDSREAEVLAVGVDPQAIAGSWSIKGRFLDEKSDFEAVIGDSVSHSMYFSSVQNNVALSNPLVEGIRLQNTTFSIVGICVDPLNNGFVTYLPINQLENVTGLSNPNLLLIKLNNSTAGETASNQIRSIVQQADPDLQVFYPSEAVERDAKFVASNWQTIMLVPLFTLISASMCLVGYTMLSIEEQRQEYAILRAVGARTKIAFSISAIQSAVALISSFVIGISFGVFITLLILMAQPIVTPLVLVEITGWLIAAVAAMFILSLYPALKLAKTPILKLMT